MTAPSTNFSSEGFDLDAVPLASESCEKVKNEVIFEIGGGASAANSEQNERRDSEDPIAKAESLKARGNDDFKNGNYLDAYDFYTDAIEACPGMTGEEILKMRDEFEEQERDRAYKRHHAEQERRRRRPPQGADNDDSSKAEDKEDEEDYPPAAVFTAPPHDHAKKLSVYHCNRAACLLHLGRYGEAISDCDVAILLNPTYTKALTRRMTAYENIDKTEDALRDAKKALECDPGNAQVRRNVARLQKVEDERLEKLKEETVGKLKDLGNSILGNFGLSLDNFKAVQDPNTGSYSISFDNKAGGSS